MIDQLVERFSQIPGATVGQGPQHPEHPDKTISRRLSEFLSDYPFLHTDPHYVEFLEKYAGAYSEDEQATQLIEILGFFDPSIDIVEIEGSVIDRDGYLIFARCVYHIEDEKGLHDTQEHDFAFDASGKRKPGVYRHYSHFGSTDEGYEWMYTDFAAWLADLVTQDGRLRPPTVQ